MTTEGVYWIHLPVLLSALCTITHFVTSSPLPLVNGTDFVTDFVEVTTLNVSETSGATQPIPHYETNLPKVSVTSLPTITLSPPESNNGSSSSIAPGTNSSTGDVPVISETPNSDTTSGVLTSLTTATVPTIATTQPTSGVSSSPAAATSTTTPTVLPTSPPTTARPTSPVIATTVPFVSSSKTASTQPPSVETTQSTTTLSNAPSTSTLQTSTTTREVSSQEPYVSKIATSARVPVHEGGTTLTISPSASKSTNIPESQTTKESGDWSIIGITGNSFTGKILLPIAVGTAFSVIIIAVAYCYCSRRGTKYTRVGKTSRNGVHQMTSNDRVMLLADSSEDEF